MVTWMPDFMNILKTPGLYTLNAPTVWPVEVRFGKLLRNIYKNKMTEGGPVAPHISTAGLGISAPARTVER